MKTPNLTAIFSTIAINNDRVGSYHILIEKLNEFGIKTFDTTSNESSFNSDFTVIKFEENLHLTKKSTNKLFCLLKDHCESIILEF
jgi:hypothetical protein